MTRRWWAGVLALVVLVAAAGVVTWRVATRPEPTTSRPELSDGGTYTPGTVSLGSPRGLQAAVSAVPIALSYDHDHLDRTVTAATSRMTSAFAADFRDTFDATVRPLALREKSVTKARVRAAGVVSARQDSMVCLVYVDQVLVSSTSITKKKSPVKVGQTRVLVRMERVGRTWKVDDLAPM